MMKLVSLFIAVIITLSLTACQNSESIGSSQPQIPVESSQSSNEPLPTEESTSIINSKISVPIQIVTDNDNPEAYQATKERAVLGTEENLKIYNEWITKLDGANVMAIYGYAAPFSEYTQGKMSLEDSQAIFNKLKSMKPTLLSEADFGNPYTGGGMSLSIQTKNERAVLSFNGGWFMVYLDNQKKQWVFDAQEKSVQNECYEIMQILAGNMNNGANEQPALLYKKAKLESIYAINANSYVMAKIEGYSLSKEIVSVLEDYRPNGTNPEGFGYLIFTEKGKEYVYLDDTNAALSKNCLAALTNAPLHPSWLIHMTPSRIINANGVTDKEKLLQLSKFLKEKVTVQAETTTHTGPSNPSTVAGLYTLRLEFDSGTYYDLVGYDYFDTTGNFSLYTSDLDRTVNYKCNKGVSAELREYLQSMT